MMRSKHPLTTSAGRVAKLLAIAESLEASMTEHYTKDTLNQYRAILDDIAKETGGRQKQVGISNSGEAVIFKVLLPDNERD